MSFTNNADRHAIYIPFPLPMPWPADDHGNPPQEMAAGSSSGIEAVGDYPTPQSGQTLAAFLMGHQIAPVTAATTGALLEPSNDHNDDRPRRVRFSGFDNVRLTYEYRDDEHSYGFCRDRHVPEKSYILPPLDRTPSGVDRDSIVLMQCVLNLRLGMDADKAQRILNSLSVIIAPMRESEQVFDAVRNGLAAMKTGKLERRAEFLHYGGHQPSNMRDLRIIARATLMAMIFIHAKKDELRIARARLDEAMAEVESTGNSKQKPVAEFTRLATAILQACLNGEDIEHAAIATIPERSCLRPT